MAAAAGKKGSTSLSLFLDAYGLEVEEELSTIASQTWAEGVWSGKWLTEQKEAWTKQNFEVQMWKQVRGLAGAVMCETSNLGIKWSQWHTLMFEGQVRVDMRYVCPKDVKKMLLRHEARERGIGGGKKTKEGWNDKHRNTARKLVLEGGWV